MIKIYPKLLFLVSVLLLASCVKKMDETYIPSYINIDEINVLTSSSQGSSSSYITDAWVYLDGDDRGAYPLPSRIPLLAEGEHLVKIAPGIKLNGVVGTRVPYPLMEPVEVDLNLIKDSVKNLNIDVRYRSNSKFEMIEDFENSNLKFETTTNNKATFRTTHSSSDPLDYVFEGVHSGGGFLNAENSYFQIITKQLFEELPKQGVPVFIELDFKCNTTIVLSVMSYRNGIGESQDLIYLSTTDEWKKIYINLTSTISYDTDAFQYKFLLSANHNANLEESVVLIDNFKLIYRDIEN
ncbi:hypothetical protein [Lentimicrobium sp. S6]|uniref:hypothetical protein n=1 Tax=Lentimicrobium sp. S6 TaxID=2735872 RepID=UPI001553658B|nr:hypothetical protein [Lentimicrobium sp. S6]NPD47233.1 hypothetical protein [Lentimicrobium sp. S6]